MLCPFFMVMKTQAFALHSIQLVVTLGYVAVVFGIAPEDWKSAIVGCVIGLLPALYFSYRMLKRVDIKDPQKWLGFAYRADLAKWLLAGILFFVVFTSGEQWNPLILFIGYLLVQISGMFLPLILKGE